MLKRANKPVEKQTGRLYGLMAKFEHQEDLIAAAERTHAAGYRKFDAYSPYPVADLARAMHLKSSPLPFLILAGGLSGGLGGFLMMTFATVIDYPMNIGGRPLFSWPAYIPITFELVILSGALAGILGLFAFTRFPQPYHPVFNNEDFNAHGSQDAFFLSIEANDPKFNLEQTRRFMEGLKSAQVSEIPEYVEVEEDEA
jgi:hypothetical protein